MKKQTVSNLSVAGVLFGGVLVNGPMSVAYFYGNLSTYIDSYYIATEGWENHSTGSLWLTTVWASMFTIGITISGIISRRIGPRLTLLSGMILYNVGAYTSFLALKSSFWLLHITFGVGTGIGAGFCYSMTLLYAAQWAKTRVGLASAVVSSASGGGSIFCNLATTFFINPQNLKPDVSVGESKYFSQDEIINRVPYVFFVLGALATIIHIIAFPLMRTHSDWAKNCKIWKFTRKSAVNHSSSLNDVDNFCMNEINNKANNTELYGATASVDLAKVTGDQHEKRVTENSETGQNSVSIICQQQATSVTFTPLQALKTKSFYLLGISIALLMVGFVVENSSYKQFGVLYISDDYFLANIGVAVSVAVCVSRIFWGSTLDKFDVKYVLIFVCSSHTILSAFWYFTPFVHKWFYLIWTLAVQASQSGSLIVYPICVLKLFGSEHYMTIYGLVMCFGVFVQYATPPLAQVILIQLGWFWLFTLVSVTSLISLILIIFFPLITKT